MSAILSSIGSFKNLFPTGITIDDTWDQVNRSFVFVILCVFGLVVTVRQHAGNIIACDGFTKFSKDFFEDYCWTQGLYTMQEAYEHGPGEVPYPGIIPMNIPPCFEAKLANGGRIKCPDRDEILPYTRIYHLWYQWVPFYFWIAAGAFYLPYMMYRNLGMSELKPLIRLLHNPMQNDDELVKTVEKAATWLYVRFSNYCRRHSNILKCGQRHGLGAVIIVTKLLYCFVSIFTFYLTAQMFELGNFWTYGLEWMGAKFEYAANDTDSRNFDYSTHIKDRLFPKMTACEIRRWGTSGMETEHGTCVLAPNVINQYLFLLLWWILLIVCCLNVLSVINATFDLCFIYYTYRRFLSNAMLKNRLAYRTLFYNIGTSGRVILILLSKQIRAKVMEAIVEELREKMKEDSAISLDLDVDKEEGDGGGAGQGNHWVGARGSLLRKKSRPKDV